MQIPLLRRAAMASTPKHPINLLRGWPNTKLLPVSLMQTASQKVLSDPTVVHPGLLYGPDEGYPPLRIEIAKWLSEFYGSPNDPQRICVSGGASQNLACILQVFTDPNVTQRIWMVAPSYYLACRIFEDAGFHGRLRAVPEDEEGIDIDYLEAEISKIPATGQPPLKNPRNPYQKFYSHVIYAVPTFSNPSGKTMSLRRRQQLVDLARRHNALIITDDVYDLLQWSTSPSSTTPHSSRALLPRLVDIDRELPRLSSSSPNDEFGNVVSNGSFSKIAGPGVRTGWAEASPLLAYGISQAGSSRSGGCPSQLTATIMCRLLQDGLLQKHIKEVLQPAYQKRHAVMTEAIEKYLVPLGVRFEKASLKGQDVFGGYFIWLELVKGMRADLVAERAKEEEDLVVAHGNLFEVYGDEESVALPNSLRLCFAWEEEPMLVEGVQRLSRVINGMLGDPASFSAGTKGDKIPMGDI